MKITMKQVASYKENEQCLQLEKPTGLVYGTNGSGKSVLSNFLYGHAKNALNEDGIFKDCRVCGVKEKTIHVFNQTYIDNNFQENDRQKAIFILGEENRGLYNEIEELNKTLVEQKAEYAHIENSLKSNKDVRDEQRNEFEKNMWSRKTVFFKNKEHAESIILKGRKTKQTWAINTENIYEQKINSQNPRPEIQNSIEELIIRIEGLASNDVAKLNSISFSFQELEEELTALISDSIWGIPIETASDSEFAKYIKELNSGDWVEQGKQNYLKADSQKATCPFCQQDINSHILGELNKYFDKSYKEKRDNLNKSVNDYRGKLKSLDNHLNSPTENPTYLKYIDDYKDYGEKIHAARKELDPVLERNQEKINEKYENLETRKTLEIPDFNKIKSYINEISKLIENYNDGIENKQETLDGYISDFWTKFCLEQEQDIKEEIDRKTVSKKECENLQQEKEPIEESIRTIEYQLSIKRNQGTNSILAAKKINDRLKHWGITGFTIQPLPLQEGLGKDLEYQVVRENNNNNEYIFKTLSEGEKTIIAFLYFILQCEEKSFSQDEEQKNKSIVIIDDPISSLTLDHVYNVADAIKRYIVNNNNKVEKVLILTHNLYFFFELERIIPRNFKNPGKDIEEFRIEKTNEGSKIQRMNIGSFRNNYQSYWIVIKSGADRFQKANAMRNILEQFFGFVKNKKLDQVIKDLEREEDNSHFRAFERYMNRGSHSDPINADIEEIDENKFLNYFGEIFKRTCYEEHYEAMMHIADEHKNI